MPPSDPRPPIIHLTPDGEVRPASSSWGFRIAVGAILVAVLAGSISIAAAAVWVVATLLPVAILAALVAYVSIRLQVRRVRRADGAAAWMRRRP